MKKKTHHTIDFEFNPIDNERLARLFGQFDQHLRQIERFLGVVIHTRGNKFNIIGPQTAIDKAQQALQKIYQEALSSIIDAARVHLILQTLTANNGVKEQLPDEELVLKTRMLQIKPRTRNQYNYVKNIMGHDINFGIGPAGTGKTFLAVACAVVALETDQVKRIVLARPAVEAGERLGFLPGDLSQKVDPYLRPLYDALYDMLGSEQVDKLIQRNVIEIAPLAYMRGRTLNDAFIILDESQNTTREQMKMFLTRIGFNSKAVITGDITQVDLPRNEQSGLRHAIELLSGIKDIHFTFFQSHDVMRHPLVQAIIQAYEQGQA